MVRTPLGDLEIQIDGKSIKYRATLMPIEGAFSELAGRYKIAVSFQPDGKSHTIACKIKDYTPSLLDEEESGENLECKSFQHGGSKLSLGMEGDMCFLNGQRMSDYDYDTGTIGKIDCFWKLIQIGNIEIEFSEIYQILLPD